MSTTAPDPVTIALLDAPDPARPGAVAEALAKAVACNNEVWGTLYGHDDFSTDERRWTEWLTNQAYSHKRLVLALVGPVDRLATSAEGLPQVVADSDVSGAEVVGVVELLAPKQDNTHLVEDVEMGVLEAWRGRGIGTALVQALEQLTRAWGRTTVMGFGMTQDVPDADEPDVIKPDEGPFVVRRSDPASRLMLGQGWELVMTERHSQQDLGPGTELPTPAWADGYEPVSWTGPIADQLAATPDLAEKVAALHTAFSASVPRGEIDSVPTVMTVEKLLHRDVENHRSHDTATVAARHVATGELVALTTLMRADAVPEAVYQEITVVLPAHRGHGLGLATKAENLRQVAERWPEARRVHTWNAGVNDHMWAINQALGYRTQGVTTCWQKKLD